MKKLLTLAAATSALLALSACSSEPAGTEADQRAVEAPNGAGALPAPSEALRGTSDAATAPAANAEVLGLEGLGELKIGRAVPAGGTWAERGAQMNESCRTVSSPDYPGVYAIVTDGKVQRITLGQRSTVKLAEGIGVGAAESEVKKWFAGFREEPHKYEEAPAKYLTAPNAANGSSALRFEIGQDGLVKMIHVGVIPVLTFVEGCG